MKVKDILDATYPRDRVMLHYSANDQSRDVDISPLGCDDYLRYGELEVMGVRAIDDTMYVYAEPITRKAKINLRKFSLRK